MWIQNTVEITSHPPLTSPNCQTKKFEGTTQKNTRRFAHGTPFKRQPASVQHRACYMCMYTLSTAEAMVQQERGAPVTACD